MASNKIEWVSKMTGEVVEDAKLDAMIFDHFRLFPELDEYDIYQQIALLRYNGKRYDPELAPTLFDVMFEDILEMEDDNKFVRDVNESMGNADCINDVGDDDYIAAVNALL